MKSQNGTLLLQCETVMNLVLDHSLQVTTTPGDDQLHKLKQVRFCVMTSFA